VSPTAARALLVTVCVAGVAALALAGPIHQEPGYHAFADPRGDVASNAAFALAGAAGLAVVVRRRGAPDVDRWTSAAWATVFAGVFLTAFGSAWYHLEPSDERLFWDRLPMAVVFAALLDVVVAERVDATLGRRLLVPLVAAGAGSVLWWRFGPQPGDLRPYAAVQFVGAAAIVTMLVCFPRRYDRAGDLVLVVALYAAAKGLESLDRPIFDATGFVSGHTLKHVVAAAAPAVLALHVARRRPIGSSP